MEFKLWHTPDNNHGCSGFEVTIEIDNPFDRIGVVVDGHSCSSCWQVGHDDSSPAIPVGTLVKLPDGLTNWQSATEFDDRFVQGDISNSGKSKVSPFDLIDL